jgi:hypothetical protein
MQIPRHSFYQGLLLAARAAGAPDTFDAESRSFHDAFEAMLEHLRTSNVRIRGLAHAQRDPVFGVYHEANELLLQAEQDLILEFNPLLRRTHARFRVQRAQAELELNDFAFADLLREVGKIFADRLK